MPELPEVESIRRSLEPRLLGRVVTAARLCRRDVLVAPGDPFGGIARQRSPIAAAPARVRRTDLLAGATIARLDRRGKQLAIIARDDDGDERALIVQLGMSGQLVHRGAGERLAQSDHIHAWWRFDDGRLVFRDPRRFGGLRVLRSLGALEEHWRGLGPDALTISAEALSAGLRHARRPIKAALLDQTVLAGVGNIYADEALFAAGIRPRRLCTRLGAGETEDLARAIRAVLGRAVAAGGSTLRDYVDAEGNPGTFQLTHAVYGRGGEPCTRCGERLHHGTLAQRATVWCGRCQA